MDVSVAFLIGLTDIMPFDNKVLRHRSSGRCLYTWGEILPFCSIDAVSLKCSRSSRDVIFNKLSSGLFKSLFKGTERGVVGCPLYFLFLCHYL